MFSVNILGETQKELSQNDKEVLAQKLRELLKKYDIELAYLEVQKWK
jgi:hypothetical protein